MKVELWAVLDGENLVAVDLRERIANAKARGVERGRGLPPHALTVTQMKGEIHGVREPTTERR